MSALKKDSLYLKGSIMMFLIRYCYYREHVEGEINKRKVVGRVGAGLVAFLYYKDRL